METKQEIEQFLEGNERMQVQVTPSVSYSLRQLIDDAYILYNRQFKSGEYEENGFHRIFIPKMWTIYRTLIQGSDIDLKNLNIRSLNGVGTQITPLLKMMFISHLEREEFGEIMDEIMAQMCWFGSSLIKRFDGTVEVIDLRNYITEANQPDPQKRRHLFSIPYTYDQMLSHKEEWKDAWADIEDLWEKMQREGITTFNILEFWTFNAEGKKACQKYLDNTVTKAEEGRHTDDWMPYVLLEEFETPYKVKRQSKRMRKKLGEWELRFPVEQFDFFACQGRTIGIGCAELLAGVQEAYNELLSNKRKIDLKNVGGGLTVHYGIRTVDGTVSQLSQEFLTNLDGSQVLTLEPNEDLKQLTFDPKSFDFKMMEELLEDMMRKLIGVTLQATGEQPLASTTATQANIDRQTQTTVFDFVKERVHFGLKRLFNKGYAQDIIEEMSIEGLISVTGDARDLEDIDNLLITNALNQWANQTFKETGIMPTEEEYTQAKEGLLSEIVKQGKDRFIKFKKEIVKDMEFMLTFDFTAESFDYKLRTDALLAILANPNSAMDKDRVEAELLTLQGLNVKHLQKTPEQLQQEQMMMQQQQQLA